MSTINDNQRNTGEMTAGNTCTPCLEIFIRSYFLIKYLKFVVIVIIC